MKRRGVVLAVTAFVVGVIGVFTITSAFGGSDPATDPANPGNGVIASNDVETGP